jgi:hypothetical protein
VRTQYLTCIKKYVMDVGGFGFLRPSNVRNTYGCPELNILLYLKHFKCVVAMIHGETGGGKKEHQIVVPIEYKNAHPCVVMWRKPEAELRELGMLDPSGKLLCRNMDDWRKCIVYKGFGSKAVWDSANVWDLACNDTDVFDATKDDATKDDEATGGRVPIIMSTNMDGGSISIINDKLNRGITFIAIARCGDSNTPVQVNTPSAAERPHYDCSRPTDRLARKSIILDSWCWCWCWCWLVQMLLVEIDCCDDVSM